MSVTARLKFDPASAADSANVGSYIRAGDDGTLIGHVSDALKVNISNASIDVTATDLDIRDLAFATDKVDVSGSSVSISGDVNVTQGTSPWVVSATDLDIRDLSASQDSIKSWTMDGTGNAIGSTSGALNVNISSGTVTTSDAALANIAGANGASSVGVTSAALIGSPLSARKYLYTFNNANHAVYLGFGTVTTANGFPMYPGQAYEFRAGASIAMNAISGTAAQDVRYLELS